MAFDINSLLGTPEGFATPAQLQQARALFGGMQKSASPDVGPQHWMGTVGNIGKSLFGGMGQNMTNALERGMNKDDSGAIGGPTPPGGGAGPTMGGTANSFMSTAPAGPPVSKPIVPPSPQADVSAGGIPTPPPIAPQKAVPWMNPMMNNPLMTKFNQRFGNWGL